MATGSVEMAGSRALLSFYVKQSPRQGTRRVAAGVSASQQRVGAGYSVGGGRFSWRQSPARGSLTADATAPTNRHQDVIDFTNAGLQAGGQQASATAVKLASLQARTHANLGNRAAAETALAHARQTMSRVPPQQQERGLFAFPEEKLASHEGQVWLQLGAPERAQEPLQRALRLLDSATGARRSPVDQAMVRLHLTRSHAELGQFDEACQRAEEALALHRQRPVEHTRRRAQELARLLKPYGEAEATQKILHELTRA